MKLDLNEIWEFMEMAPEPKTASEGDHWIYELIAGNIAIQRLKTEDIVNLKKEEFYDTELLPSIFTFREILWQPNVYKSPATCIPQLNILRVFCEDFEQDFSQKEGLEKWPFFELLRGVSKCCTEATEKLSTINSNKETEIARILGQFRRDTFPVIQFFISHPMNRKDYQMDAVNRLNYAVKIMLTQYNNKYFELKDPYWNISIGNGSTNYETYNNTATSAPSPSSSDQPDTETQPSESASDEPSDHLANTDHFLEEL